MNTITHALLPVIAAHFVGRSSHQPIAGKVWGKREMVAIGVFGAAPDLLNPHLSLAARYTSWSHGLPAWAGVTVLLITGAVFFRSQLSFKLAGWCSWAYLLHLFCDLIAGGIAWLYPIGDGVIGRYWVEPKWWAWIDAGCLLTVYTLWRVIPGLKARKESDRAINRASQDPPTR